MWIKVTDRLPDLDKWVLVTNSKDGYQCWTNCIYRMPKVMGCPERPMWSIHTEGRDEISHWQPLPERPKN